MKLSASRIAGYTGAFVILVAIVALGYDSPKNTVAQSTSASGLAPSAVVDDTTPSVDEVLATDIAADLAERGDLPIAKNVANLSVSLTAKSEIAQSADTTAISKPQIIKPTGTNRGISTYTVEKGDTVASIATKFGISADTVRWANNLGDTDAVAAGRKLKILPVSGVLYTVKSGDTAASIASAYSSNAKRIVAVNDLELGGLSSGKQIIVPDGVKPVQLQTATGVAGNTVVGNSGDLGGGVIDPGIRGASTGNGYAWGNCTWYAYERRAQLGKPIGGNWGNASAWAYSARLNGFVVNGSPSAGAVLVDQSGYFGHVAVVERVKSNGDIVISEMNNYAYGGFGIVNQRTISAGQAGAYIYIH